MKAVRIPVEGTPEIIDMPDSLEGMQAEVGGYIEAVRLSPAWVTGWVNEDGKLLGLDRNPVATMFAGQRDWIAGPMLVTAHNPTDFAGLSEKQAEDVAQAALTLKEVVR